MWISILFAGDHNLYFMKFESSQRDFHFLYSLTYTSRSYPSVKFPGGGGGGVLRFGSDGGVPLKPPNPYPSLRVILAEKGTHY